MKKKIIYSLLTVFISLSVNAQKKAKSNSGKFLVNCKLSSYDSRKIKTVDLKIYENNNIYFAGNEVNIKSHVIELDYGKQFVLEFSKNGFITKRVYIDTNKPDLSKNKYFFDMEISLLKPIEVAQMNDIELDFPIAIISYNEKKKTFIHSDYYTHQMQLEELRLLKRKGKIN
jgi:hypothetical protein